MNSRTVDLIYLDPPFNSKRQYQAPTETPAEGQKFDDNWKWTDLDDRWLSEIDSRNEALSAVIRAARLAQNEGTAAYLTMMGIRLLELHRVLKSAGSIYLHCDPTASHYLKASMDAVFGGKHFRNEIVWHYNSGARGNNFGKRHDVLLWYSKSKSYTFNKDSVRTPYSPNINIPKSKRHYYHPDGKVMGDVWQINIIAQNDKTERTGWSTQKPLALLKRVIQAGSNEGDVVLDPFAGCATCCVAAEIEGRQWVGIEYCEEATKITRRRLNEADLGSLGRSRSRVIIKRSVPRRTDADAPPPEKPKPKRTTSYKTIENMQKLYGRQFGDCNGCGVHYRDKDFHHDHIHPRSKDGGDEIENLQLLCGNCNSTKGNRDMERLWELLYERESPISPAGWKYLRQRGRKDWRIA